MHQMIHEITGLAMQAPSGLQKHNLITSPAIARSSPQMPQPSSSAAPGAPQPAASAFTVSPSQIQ
ncbi:hypothetical protein Hypma_001577 [Hypsizygus marmoreus]|uniref:Uncharacterized protein n=1 Tax=Hypsizygus marmoreus TaxID=39966 RepID=A0A369K3R6_HYPMA|nr:hypothetical protein Hypma_001577 [Hypsizygus marmoreus]